MNNPHKKELIKLLQSTCGRHGMYDVFRDFCEMAACALANACDPIGFDAREAKYMQDRKSVV